MAKRYMQYKLLLRVFFYFYCMTSPAMQFRLFVTFFYSRFSLQDFFSCISRTNSVHIKWMIFWIKKNTRMTIMFLNFVWFGNGMNISTWKKRKEKIRLGSKKISFDFFASPVSTQVLNIFSLRSNSFDFVWWVLFRDNLKKN